ncbi:LysR family transcriptional regulator [Thaumasiovibrio subtropicus]|uniref:LysR family transcriptional regulator n=1 Tax=Thaumasiovibrio subtropicus TaxID=1891207 RepID=UPI000B34EDF2|nr:LysR family transcriptional regulator [Thaumasiovibrio subtropicus]
MELEEIYRRDLNLLVALRILIDEGSVSRAALRLNLSQSAMSRVLARLRALVNDPLFIREGQKLIPTQRALELNQALNVPLESLRIALTPQDFVPQDCEQAFNIATTDYAIQTILPFALSRIYQEAPNISLNFVPLQHQRLAEQLTQGGCDMAICRPAYAVEELQQSVLGPVSVFCLLSRDHPLANKEMTLDDYLSYPHATIAISDGVKRLIDDALQDYPDRREVLRAYHLEAALAVVEQVPLIITVPADLAYLKAEKHDLIIKPMPFPFKPFDYSLLWHPRNEHSPAQQWLRRMIQEECGKLINSRIHAMGLADT